MTNSDESAPADRGTQGSNIRLNARASGHGFVIVSGRDTHYYHPDGVRSRRRTETTSPAPACPYPGLAAFGARYARWFHGRDQITAQLIIRVSQCLDSGGPLFVVGPSGVGKSSLLHAGLLPSLEEGRLPVAGSQNWPRVVLTPGAHPLLALASSLAAALGEDPAAVAASWDEDPVRFVEQAADTDAFALGLRNALTTMRTQDDTIVPRVILVIDQFEEVFTQCADERERRAFIDLLNSIAGPDTASAENRVAVAVVGMRADFYSHCADYPALREALQRNQILLGPMTETEVRQAILSPAQAVGLQVEPGLIELLQRDLGIAQNQPAAAASDHGDIAYEAGRLPLLAHALQATWQQRHGHLLTVEGYRDTGGIEHAIAASAESVYTRLDKAERLAARTLFLNLVRLGEGTEDVRRQVSRQTLSGSDPQGRIATVIDAFTDARLLTLDHDLVAMTHEVLLRAWPRLRDWIEQDRAGNLVRQHLEEDALAWHGASREPAALYQGSRLETAHAWSLNHPHESSELAAAFLAAARRRQRRGRRLRRAVVVGITALALAASGAAIVAFQQRGAALHDRDLMLYNQILANADRLQSTDESLSAELSLVAYRLQPGPDAASRLITDAAGPLATPVTGHSGQVRAVAFSPNGRIMATGGGGDYTVRLWDMTDPGNPTSVGPPLTGVNDSVMALAFTPDGHTLAVADNDNKTSLQLWNVTDPAHPAPITAPIAVGAAVGSVAFSPDGRILATGISHGANSGTVTVPGLQLWNAANPARLTLLSRTLVGGDESVDWLTFSPDGHTLVTPNQLWNVSDPSRPTAEGPPVQGATIAQAMAFNPANHIVATGNNQDQSVQLWNTADPAHTRRVGQAQIGATGGPTATVFSPDGRTLAIGCDNGEIELWNVMDPDSPILIGQPLSGHHLTVWDLAFSPDGRTLASASEDGTVRVWNLPVMLPTGQSGDYNLGNDVESVAYRPGGKYLAAAMSNGSTSLIDLADASRPKTIMRLLSGDTFFDCAVAFSPDGRTVVTGSFDGSAVMWNVTDPLHAAAIQRLTGDSGNVCALAYSPDGKILATGSRDDRVLLWDVSDPARPTALGQPLTTYTTSINAVAFSPDRRTLAMGSDDGRIWLWNIAEPRRPVPLGAPLSGHTAAVETVAFSPDGRTLASGAGDHTVILWNVADPSHPTQLGPPLTGHTDYVGSLAFSTDGHTLAAAGDTTIWLWNVTDPSHPAQLGPPLTGHDKRVMSITFSTDGHTLASAGADRSIRFWDLDIDHDIARICATTRNTLTAQAWQQYVGNVPRYQPPC